LKAANLVPAKISSLKVEYLWHGSIFVQESMYKGSYYES